MTFQANGRTLIWPHYRLCQLVKGTSEDMNRGNPFITTLQIPQHFPIQPPGNRAETNQSVLELFG